MAIERLALIYWDMSSFIPITGSADFPQRIYSHFTGNWWEMTVYLGLINVGLFTWAYVNRKRLGIKEMGFLFWGILVFMLLASGSVLRVLGKPLTVLPTIVLEFIPFVKNVRTPSRAVVFVYLFLGIGVGLAIEAIMDKFAGRKGVRFAWLTIITVLIFTDFYPTRLEATKVVCPPAYGSIIQDKDPNFGILDLPRGYECNNAYMMYQAACHKKPIVIATVSRTVRTTLEDRLEMSDIEKQKEQLTSNRVKYIVIHKGYLEDGRMVEECRRVVASYPVIYVDNDNTVLRVY